MEKKLISIITPVYNEQDLMLDYFKQVIEFLDNRTEYYFEVLLVDDGSHDKSWALIQEICSRDSRFRGIRLSRNFGSHTALAAGIDEAKGDAVMTLASDLQDPIETFDLFADKWLEGAQIVWGKRRSRKDAGWKILCSNIFFMAIKRYAMPRGSLFTTGSFFLIDKSVAKCVRSMREQNRITFSLVAWTGFQQDVVEYDRKERGAGKSGWTFFMMIKGMYDTFLAFSHLPVRMITILGLFTSFLSFLYGVQIVLASLAGNPQPGWTSTMVVMVFLFGLMFFCISVVGEYLYRIYSEVVRRPLYFISQRTKDE